MITLNASDIPNRPAVCGRCQRPVAAARDTCVYCGFSISNYPKSRNSLDVTPESVDESTPGFNVVAVGQLDGIDLESLASALGLHRSYLESISGIAEGLPIARVSTEERAQAIVGDLMDLGLRCLTVPDRAVTLTRPNRRFGSIRASAEGVVLLDLTTGEETSFGLRDRFLLVEGVICTSRTDTVKKGRGENARIQEQAAIDSDEVVLDLYCAGHDVGFRAFASGFDFSVLGPNKGLLVRDNWGRLLETLVKTIPNLRFDTTYRHIRTAISAIWATESRSERLERATMLEGRRRSASVETTTNLGQFNKYSGLKRYLHERPAD